MQRKLLANILISDFSMTVDWLAEHNELFDTLLEILIFVLRVQKIILSILKIWKQYFSLVVFYQTDAKRGRSQE